MLAFRRSCTVAAVVLLLALPAGISVVDAHAPPTPVCPVCDDELEDAGDRAATYVDVKRSNVTVRVDRNGDARVRANVTLTDASARRLADDPDAVRRVVDEALASNAGLWAERLRNVSATLDGTVLAVTYDVPGVARATTGGGRLVSAFAGVDADYSVNADRFVVYGPTGWSVANRPHSGRVSTAHVGDGVVWRGDAAEDGRAHLGGRTYVALAPDTTGMLGAVAAIAVASARLHLVHAAAFGAFTAFALGVLLGGCVLFGDEAYDRDAAAAGLTWSGLSTAAFLLGFAVLDGVPLFGTGWFGVVGPFLGIAGFGRLLQETRSVETERQAFAFLAATVGSGTAIAVVTVGGFVASMALLAAAGVGGAYLLGLVETGSAKRRVWASATVGAAAATLPLTPVASGAGQFVALLFLWFVTIVGAPFVFVAYRAGVGTTLAGRTTEGGVPANGQVLDDSPE